MNNELEEYNANKLYKSIIADISIGLLPIYDFITENNWLYKIQELGLKEVDFSIIIYNIIKCFERSIEIDNDSVKSTSLKSSVTQIQGQNKIESSTIDENEKDNIIDIESTLKLIGFNTNECKSIMSDITFTNYDTLMNWISYHGSR